MTISKIVLIISLTFSYSFAQVLISPLDAMLETFSQSALVKKKTINLPKEKRKLIQKKAKTKLKSKKFQYFIAKVDKKVVGYGILVSRKVRTKNAVTMYKIDTKGVIKDVEIIAFNEPLEFIASQKWLHSFQNTPYTKKLKIKKDIPTITGATLTARSIIDGSRIASAFYEVMLKDK